ncbi:unnamed protein product [Prorocentrum cordatum]|uniref:Uncharacterized protein n=1 Tax=Prorocentrum cordatum TaxID=2364126 RepID=A0ABN9WHE4_9DINO|nr:unnamed protein product [Polarella glacialis]
MSTMSLASFATPRKDIPNDTLIIFDWDPDDTLLCSSAINMQQWSQLQLDVLCRTVETTLRAAMELGEVMIVTNGVDWWVEDDSCRRFLPGLLPLLGKLHVKSARHDYERIYPGDPFAWKRECFKDGTSSSRGPRLRTSSCWATLSPRFAPPTERCPAWSTPRW